MKGVEVSRTREGNVSMSLSVTNGRKEKEKSLCHQLIGAYGRKNYSMYINNIQAF